MEKPRYLVLDVDETLVVSVKKHVVILNAIGKKLGWKNLPSYEDVLAAGGTHKAYGHFPGYWELNEHMRNAAWFNQDLEVIQEALDAMTLLESAVAFYLTTRPSGLTEVTYRELRKAGFPDRPVITRPDSVPLEQTTEWKTSELDEKAEQLGARLVMVDDSMSIHKHIKRRRGHGDVGTLLYAGVMTPRGNGEVTWKDIPKKMHAA